ncbi:MAG: hypothetical protein OER43_11585 [Gammaproteobacteria bacterium]|nr:hypothetical protein [Gammaproteobacteria bacterium]MDH3414013.1 hypothetical protein [Gammaproteobacteria bacterium]
MALFSVEAFAGDVSVEFARFNARGGGAWQVSVTLRHSDTGWDHYADAWRVVTEDGSVIGTRTLYHPHVDEQPFTRSLSGLKLPADVTRVYVEAHDKVHGWSADRLEVDLNLTSGDRFKVER